MGRGQLRFCLLIAAASVVAQAVASDAAAPPAATARCGPYALVHVSGLVPKAGGTLTLVDGRDRRVFEIRERQVNVERCEDVTGDDQPELIVSTFSGGQRCCTTFHVLALGPPVRTLLRWEAGYESDLESTDFADATRAKELAGRDDRLSFFGGLPATAAPTLPVVFCYERSAFVECSRRFDDPLLVELAESRQALKDEKDAARRQVAGLSALVLSIMLDEETAGWTWLRELAADVVPWLNERRAALTACLQTSAMAPRDERLARCAAGKEPK